MNNESLKAAAENPATAPETLAELASCEDYYVRIRVAGNPSTPPAVLATIAKTDPNPAIFFAVALNPSYQAD